MRAAFLIGIAVAGCGGRVAPEALPVMPRTEVPAEPVPPVAAADPRRPILWSEARWGTPEEVRDLWARMRINGRNWHERVEAIPRRPDLRAAMAAGLLRDGNIGCPVVETTLSCTTVRELERPPVDADIGDGCLRRELAMWALDQLPVETLSTELWDATIALFRLPAPERELNQRALDKIRDVPWMVENAVWEAISVNREFVEANLHVLSAEQQYQAALHHDIDAALLILDVEAYPQLFIDALTSTQLRNDTKVEAAMRLVGLVSRLDADSEHHARIRQSLGYSSRRSDTSCAVAGVAFSVSPDGLMELVRTRARTEDELIRQICIAAYATGGRGPAWKRLITQHDLAVTAHYDDRFRVDALWTKHPEVADANLDGAPDVPEADQDGDGDPKTWDRTEQRYYHKWFELPFAEELTGALPSCDGVECVLPDSPVEFRFEIRKERGGRLRVHGIHRYERVGEDC